MIESPTCETTNRESLAANAAVKARGPQGSATTAVWWNLPWESGTGQWWQRFEKPIGLNRTEQLRRMTHHRPDRMPG